MTDTDDMVSEILDEISDEYEFDRDEVQQKYEDYLEHMTSPTQAKEATMRKLANERDVQIAELVGEQTSSNEEMGLSEFDDDQWGEVTATVVDLWESDSDAVRQSGLLDDGESTLAFVMWSNDTDDLLTLEEDETYVFSSVVGNKNDGDMQIQVNSSSEVEEADEYIEPSDSSVTFEGVVLDTGGASGLVLRDPETGRVVESNDSDVERDLRLILAVDDGEQVYKASFNRELTEEITGMTLDDAVELAQEAMNREAVIDEMLPDLLGRYIEVEGPERNGYILVNEYEWKDSMPDVEELLIKARSMT